MQWFEGAALDFSSGAEENREGVVLSLVSRSHAEF